MYDAVNDPYCYPGTKVLKNRAKIRRANELRQFELAMTTQRFDEPLPGGRFSVSHYCAVHHHLFQDVTHGPENFAVSKFRDVGALSAIRKT
jgi:cell filamentation protein